MSGHAAVFKSFLCTPDLRVVYFSMRIPLWFIMGGVALLCSSFKHKNKGYPEFSIRSVRHVNLKKIPEPSDVVYDSTNSHLYIVSDHGILFETDTNGTVLRKAKEEGLDYEGVEIAGEHIYVSDETPRKVYKYNKKDLSLEKTYTVNWSGGMNKAFESITYNYSKNCFVLVSEVPVVIIEYNENFEVLEKHPFHEARNMSSARWYKGYLYLLSSLDECIFKLDPVSYTVLAKYKIGVYNPEGFAFDGNSKLMVTSDDLQRMYYFNKLPQ